jgi:hypothetical protein
MKKFLILFLAFVLTACLSPSEDAAPQTIEPISTLEATVTATIPPAPTATATEILFAALSPEEQAALYLAGKVQDVGELNFDQQKAFSIALDEKRDEQRGPNPIIFTDKNGVKFLIDPITLDFIPYDKKVAAEEQTIDNTLPRVIDAEGFTHVYYNGEWIRIEGSGKIYDDFDNFPWPAGEKVDPKWVSDPSYHDLTSPEYFYRVLGDKINMVPIFFLNKEVGEINIPGFGINGTLISFSINENSRFSVTGSFVTGAPTLYGDDFKAGSPGELAEVSHFYQNLEVNKVYYVMYKVNQVQAAKDAYPKSDGVNVNSNHEGIAPLEQTHDIITGSITSNKMSLVQPVLIVEANEPDDN